jgi:hypothetical protein
MFFVFSCPLLLLVAVSVMTVGAVSVMDGGRGVRHCEERSNPDYQGAGLLRSSQ